MHYLEKKLAENLGIAAATGSNLAVYDDTACSQELLDTWRNGHFQKIDIALQFSINGAQLCLDQPSKAWVFIWVIHNFIRKMECYWQY